MFFPCPFTLLHLLSTYLQFAYLHTPGIFAVGILAYIGFIKTLKNAKLATYYNLTNEQKTTTYYCNPILHLYQLSRSFFVLDTLKLWR